MTTPQVPTATVTLPSGAEMPLLGFGTWTLRGELDRSSNVLFAHLGGQPAINGYASLFT